MSAPREQLPAWLAGRPDWFVDNVERYAALLAGLARPEDALEEGWAETREDMLTRLVARLVDGMNEDAGATVAIVRIRESEGFVVRWPAGSLPSLAPHGRTAPPPGEPAP